MRSSVKAVVPSRFPVTRVDVDKPRVGRGTISWGRLDNKTLPSGMCTTPTEASHGRVAIWRDLSVQGTCRSAPGDHPGIGAIVNHGSVPEMTLEFGFQSAQLFSSLKRSFQLISFWNAIAIHE